jgi:hypothetical protein
MEDFTLIDKCCLLCAKRNSGKSQLLRYLVKCQISSFDKIYVISPTECVNAFYSGITSKECIFDEYNDDWMMKLISKMTEITSKKEKKKVLIILDDCVADTDLHHNAKALKILYARSRHIGIAIILTTQYINSVSPFMRLNSDYIFLGQQNRKSIDIICDEYISGNIDRSEFIKIFSQSTKDYSFLVVNNNSIKDTDDLNLIYGSIKTPPNFIK